MPTINIVPADALACGYYRLKQQADLLFTARKEVVVSPPGHFNTFNPDVFYTQRICSQKVLPLMRQLKESTGAEIIIDYDDLTWLYQNQSVPEYNWCSEKLDVLGNTAAMEAHLNEVADKITVSTEEIKKSLLQFVPEEKITVIPNMLSYKEWGFEMPKSAPAEDIFYYAGSDTHFSNDKKMLGDFSSGLAKFLSNKKIVCKATVPWFLSPQKMYAPSPLSRYARDFYSETRECKFILAPLADNVFNRCKSHLKYLESCAVGRVCLVSSFDGCPYEGAHEYQKIPVGSTAKAIKYIVDRASENYVEILNWQYQYLAQHWLDNNMKIYTDLLGI